MSGPFAGVQRLRNVPNIGVDRMGAAAEEAARRNPHVLRMENLDTDLRPREAALRATREAIDSDEGAVPTFFTDRVCPLRSPRRGQTSRNG